MIILFINREVKHDVYGKWQTAKMKLLPFFFSSLHSRIKIFVFAVNSKRRFLFLCDLFKDYKKRGNLCRLLSVVNVMLKLSNVIQNMTYALVCLTFLIGSQSEEC